jgi:hypothetical protein
MRISNKQISSALVDYDLSSEEIAVALHKLEETLDSVAESLDNDFESAALGDASNLIQLMRWGLNNGME